MPHSQLQQGIGGARLGQLSETWMVGQEPPLEVEGEEDMYFQGQGASAYAFCSAYSDGIFTFSKCVGAIGP